MAQPDTTYATLDEWIAREAISFSVEQPETFHAAIDKVIASLGDAVALLGLGEALHGGEDILILRNQFFQYLVEAHGYSAIAIESSFPKSHAVNEYIAGHGPTSYEAVQESGFSSGFGRLDANRELVEWMRSYNADASHLIKLHFYGFDSPTESTSTESPSHILHVVLDYLASIDAASSQAYRSRIDSLIGQDAAWENPAAIMDATQAIGLSPKATALRIETENLISELHIRRPELVAKSNESRYLEAMHYASVARQLLNYHAALAETSDKRLVKLLGIRDAFMADNLAYIVSHERDRGHVLAFAHNSHLGRGMEQWQSGTELLTWWPAGTHLNEMFGTRYVVIGSAVGVSAANGIGQPELGTLENRLTAAPGPARFIPTHRGYGLPLSDIPTRSGSTKNRSYFALTPRSMSNFDWLLVLDSTTYSRNWWNLEDMSASSE